MVKRGQHFTLNGHQWRVVYVNQSRAHCVCTDRRVVTLVNHETGATRSFEGTVSRSLDISPNTPLDFLKEALS